MASTMSLVTSSPLTRKKSSCLSTPSASLTLMAGSRNRSFVSVASSSSGRSPLLHCSFVPSPAFSLSFPYSFSGAPLGLDFGSDSGVRKQKRRGLVVRAGKPALCLTKRNRSRKSLARTHGFRRRMRTTSGRAVLKRRRAKGRWVLCTKSHPNSGK